SAMILSRGRHFARPIRWLSRLRSAPWVGTWHDQSDGFHAYDTLPGSALGTTNTMVFTVTIRSLGRHLARPIRWLSRVRYAPWVGTWHDQYDGFHGYDTLPGSALGTTNTMAFTGTIRSLGRHLARPIRWIPPLRYAPCVVTMKN